MRLYAKLAQDIIFSSLWELDGDTCKIWITFLALKDELGIVNKNITGISRITGIPIAKCEEAIEFFLRPDPLSGSKELDGRRLKALPEGGWLVVNHDKYQELGWSEDKKRMERERKAAYRARLDANKNIIPPESPPKPPKSKPETDDEWLIELQSNPTYGSLNIKQEYGKMVAWCGVHKKVPTQRRFVNWLNRADKPMTSSAGTNGKPPTIFELTKIIEAKESLAKSIRGKFCSDVAMGVQWSNEEKRIEWAKLRNEIKELTQKLGAMA